MKNRLKQAYKIATKLANQGLIKQKNYYDQKARAAVVEPGDRVLVKILAFESRQKISDKWEDSVYTVLEQPNKDIPVSVVKREDGLCPARKLHNVA